MQTKVTGCDIFIESGQVSFDCPNCGKEIEHDMGSIYGGGCECGDWSSDVVMTLVPSA